MNKYRGKDAITGEWVTGDKVTIGKDIYILPDYCNEIEHAEEDLYLIQGLISIDPSTLAQETGLSDKNSKPIFGSFPVDGVMSKGGDIIKYMDGNNFVIEWRDAHFVQHNIYMQGKHKMHRIYDLVNYGKLKNCNYNHEVIGNATDNPELIGGE